MGKRPGPSTHKSESEPKLAAARQKWYFHIRPDTAEASCRARRKPCMAVRMCGYCTEAYRRWLCFILELLPPGDGERIGIRKGDDFTKWFFSRSWVPECSVCNMKDPVPEPWDRCYKCQKRFCNFAKTWPADLKFRVELTKRLFASEGRVDGGGGHHESGAAAGTARKSRDLSHLVQTGIAYLEEIYGEEMPSTRLQQSHEELLLDQLPLEKKQRLLEGNMRIAAYGGAPSDSSSSSSSASAGAAAAEIGTYRDVHAVESEVLSAGTSVKWNAQLSRVLSSTIKGVVSALRELPPEALIALREFNPLEVIDNSDKQQLVDLKKIINNKIAADEKRSKEIIHKLEKRVSHMRPLILTNDVEKQSKILNRLKLIGSNGPPVLPSHLSAYQSPLAKMEWRDESLSWAVSVGKNETYEFPVGLWGFGLAKVMALTVAHAMGQKVAPDEITERNVEMEYPRLVKAAIKILSQTDLQSNEKLLWPPNLVKNITKT